MHPIEPLPQLFARSKILILDFTQISSSTPKEENIRHYFENCLRNNINPRLPENRQKFNDQLLTQSGYRYLIGRYGEDRVAMLHDTPAGKFGRTIHMAIDIFSKDLEPVIAPFSGEIVRSDYEDGFGEYGNYLVLKPESENFYVFFGHLAKDRTGIGRMRAGQIIAHLGDYPNNENGGWSRHLHLQILKRMPPNSQTPIGYSSSEDFSVNSELYPNPLDYFPQWRLA